MASKSGSKFRNNIHFLSFLFSFMTENLIEMFEQKVSKQFTVY